MLAIRMQRTGRKGLANYRIVVQDSRFSPSSGRVVSLLGHYNPHTKEVVLDKQKAEAYLNNGAQPSSRVVRVFKERSVQLPSWVKEKSQSSTRTTKNPEKLRKNNIQQEDEQMPSSEDSIDQAS